MGMGPICHRPQGPIGRGPKGVRAAGAGRWRGHQPKRAQMVAGARAGPFGAMGRAQATGAQWGAGQGVAAGEAGHGHGARVGGEHVRSNSRSTRRGSGCAGWRWC